MAFMIEQVRYVGPYDHLRGKTALVKLDHELVQEQMVLVAFLQFDEPGLEHRGKRVDHGWHAFNPAHVRRLRPHQAN